MSWESPDGRFYGQQAVYIHKNKSNNAIPIRKSMSQLSGSGFKMYMYFMSLTNGTKLFLSPIKVHAVTGMCQRTYIDTKKELVSKEFLIPREDGDFDFYCVSQHKEPKPEPYVPDRIRTITIDDDEQWVSIQDICFVLGYDNFNRAMRRYTATEHRTSMVIGRGRSIACTNVMGLRSLIYNSPIEDDEDIDLLKEMALNGECFDDLVAKIKIMADKILDEIKEEEESEIDDEC